MNNNSPIKLRLPRQDLAEFKIFEPDADAAHAWAQKLPVTNTQKVMEELQDAVSALNRTELKPEDRFHILEALRPSIHVALSNLSRKFLNRPLVLPEEPRKLLSMASKLYKLSATAYTITALHTIQQRDGIHTVNPARLVCEALQRSMHFYGRNILQSLQLYQPVEPLSWQSLHQLYALAERQQLAALPVVDRLSGGGSILTTYLQAVMLGCCKPNQLRQADMAAIYQGVLQWGEYIHMEDPEAGRGLFLIDLASDQPPLYSSIYPELPGTQCRFIDTSALVSYLETTRTSENYDRSKGLMLDRDNSVSDDILQHLIAALGDVSTRNFSRASNAGTLTVAIGLHNTHLQVAGGLPFEKIIFGIAYELSPEDLALSNPFLAARPKRDKWEQANPDEIRLGEEYNDSSHRHEADVFMDEHTRAALEHEEVDKTGNDDCQEVEIINASPGGYCLKLAPGVSTAAAGTGEILCLRDTGGMGWSIALVRWFNQEEDGSALIGVELISPKAEPYGARIIRKQHATDPMRALLLPEIKLVGQPNTLLVPKAGFKENQRVELVKDGEVFNIQLTRQLPLTGKYGQFEFRYLKDLDNTLKEVQKDSPDGPSFQSLWSKI